MRLDIEETPPAIFIIKTQPYDCCFMFFSVFCFYDHQISIVEHFSVDSIKSEFENKKKVEF